jgi:hypothetical protein
MFKVVMWLIGLLAVIAILTFIGRAFHSAPVPDRVEEEASSTAHALGEYFRSEITARGIARMGQPIEGFDANLLLSAFPGMLQVDFNGVETSEGHYVYDEVNALSFVRDTEEFITSAERAISVDGFDTLLSNIARRLNSELTDTSSVDSVLAHIDTYIAPTFMEKAVLLNETIEAFGVQVTPYGVVEDNCVQSETCGDTDTVRVRVEIKNEIGESLEVLGLGETVMTDTSTIMLLSVTPEGNNGDTVLSDTYRFLFRFEKRNGSEIVSP